MAYFKLITFIIILLISSNSYSYFKGDVNVDSLKRLIKNSKKDTTKIMLHVQISEYYLGMDNEIAAKYAQNALNLATKKNFSKGKAKAYYCLAMCNVYKAKNYIALEYFKKAYNLFVELEDKKQIAGILNNIGIIYENESNYPKALTYYFRALKVNKSMNFEMWMAANLNGIASIYALQNDYYKALKYFRQAFQINQKLNNLNWLSINLTNIGTIYQNLNKLDLALKYYEKAFKIDKKINDLYNLSLDYGNMGSIFVLQNKYTNALYYYTKSLEINKKIENQVELSSTYYSIADLYFNLFFYENKANIKHLSTAKLYLDSSINIAKKINNIKTLSECYKSLSSINEKENNFKLSLFNYKKYTKLKDSIFNSENKEKLAKAGLQFAFDQREAKIKFEHEKKISKNKNILNIVLIALIICVFFLLVVFNQRNKIKNEKQIVEEKRSIIEQKNQEILESITYAKRIQSAILPQPKLVKEFLEDSFVLYKPKDIVAGDFYWLEVVGDTVLFAAADCTGHGVPGAMVSVVCNNGLNRAVREYGLKEPNLILDKTRELVVEEFEKSDEEVKDGMDISLCALDTKTNTLKWAGANNPLWILRNGEIIEFKADKQPIGKYSDQKPFTLHEINLEKGDNIYIFTDGYQDQFGGPKEKKFRAAQMKDLFLSLDVKTMEEQRKVIDNAFEDWKGKLEQVDDICIIGVRI